MLYFRPDDVQTDAGRVRKLPFAIDHIGNEQMRLIESTIENLDLSETMPCVRNVGERHVVGDEQRLWVTIFVPYGTQHESLFIEQAAQRICNTVNAALVPKPVPLIRNTTSAEASPLQPA